MQHGQFAGATFCSQKSGNFYHPAKGGCLKPAGRFAQGQHSNFQFYLSLRTVFSLRGAVLQPPFAYWNPGWRVAQCFALNQVAGEFDAVQP